MTVDIIKVVAEVGSIGVLILVLYFVARYGGQFVSRLMDNLEEQSESNKAAIAVQQTGIAAQQNLASNLAKLNDRVDRHDEAVQECSQLIMAELGKIQASWIEAIGVLRGLAQQQQAHEGRAQARQEQLQKRDQELIDLLISVRNGNGKAQDPSGNSPSSL